MEMINEIKIELEKSVGKLVTSVIAGGSNGSIIILDFGVNEFSLFVYSSWRISHQGQILATSQDNNAPLTGVITVQAKELTDDKIKKIELGPFVDLKITFESSKMLDIFSDLAKDDITNQNWSYANKKENVCYNANNNVLFEKVKYRK
jgi:hypothetical protein